MKLVGGEAVSTQPEALRLADALEALNGAKKLLPCVGGETLGTEVYRIRLSGSDAGELLDAADELRRQHAGIKRLHGLLEKAREEIRSDWGNCHYLCWLMYEIEDALQEVKP
jgi:hypothetical protein